MKHVYCVLVTTVLVFAATTTSASVTPLSIYDIQYTTAPDQASPYAGQTVDCAGGIVLHKYLGNKTKLAIYDPTYSTGWGGVFAVAYGDEYENIEPGDVVSLTGMLVEEYRGNTHLNYQAGSAVTVTGTAPLPAPLVVTPGDILTPDAGHIAEMYEAMPLQVQNVTVVAKDLGKASDNYALQNATGTCWGTDYYISGQTGAPYHPLVQVGNNLDSVTGILEQYVKYDWDYYQLCTTSLDSVVPEPVSLLLLASGALIISRRRGRSA